MTTRELITRMRANFVIEWAKNDDAVHAFDIAANETLLDIVDGHAAAPKAKRGGGRPRKQKHDPPAGDGDSA